MHNITDIFTKEETISSLRVGDVTKYGIIVSGTQKYMGKEIPIVAGGFGIGKKCILDKTIAEIHNQPVTEIRRRINDNIKRFKENVDFIDLKKGMGDAHTFDLLIILGYVKSSITQAEHAKLVGNEHEVTK